MTENRNNGGLSAEHAADTKAEAFTRADALAALEADYASEDHLDINDPANDYSSAREDHGCAGAEADEAVFAAQAEDDVWRSYQARSLATCSSSKEA